MNKHFYCRELLSSSVSSSLIEDEVEDEEKIKECDILVDEFKCRLNEKLKLLQGKIFFKLENSSMKVSSKERLINKIIPLLDNYLNIVKEETVSEINKILI